MIIVFCSYMSHFVLKLDFKRFRAIKTQAVSIFSRKILQRQNSHHDKIWTMDSFKAFCNDGFDSQKFDAFSGPVARRSHSVILSSQNDWPDSVFAIVHRRLVNRRILFIKPIIRETAALSFCQFVFQANIGKRSAHHHLMIAATRTVGIKIAHSNIMLLQIPSGRSVRADKTCRRNVVSRDGVAQFGQNTQSGQMRLSALIVKKRCRSQVSGFFIPLISFANRRNESVPYLVLLKDAIVIFGKEFGFNVIMNAIRDFFRFRPDFFQTDVFSFIIFAKRLMFQINVKRSSKRVSHDHRRWSKISVFDKRIDASLKITISAFNCSKRIPCLFHGNRNFFFQTTGIADAGHAAIPCQIEAQLVQIRLQTGSLQIFGHDARAGRKRSLDVCRNL